MYSQILKKKKKVMQEEGNLSEKDMEAMEEEDSDEGMPEQEEGSLSGKDTKKMIPEAKIEIELMLNSAKKKKK